MLPFSKMNIERLYPICFILCAAAGAVIGKFSGHGIIRGLTDGMLIAALPVFLLIFGHLLWTFWRPILPACRCRQCNHRGYRYAGSTDNQTGGPVRFSCPKCGRVYEVSGNRFNELAADGSTIPYMHHSRWGRWKAAKAGQFSSGDAAK